MKSLLSVFSMLLLVVSVRAQEAAPWPPDPSAIFAPEVEIIGVEQINLPSTVIAPTATPPPPNHCGGGVGQPWLAWVFDSPPDATHLCNTKTGELSPPLPDGFTWNLFNRDRRLEPTTSPDGKWVIFPGIKEDANRRYMILSYDPAAQTFQVIGRFSYGDNLRYDNWITNQILLIDTYNMGNRNAYDHFMYVVDLRYSIINTFGTIYDDLVQYAADPPRIIIKTPPIDLYHCSERIYTIETRQLVTHDYSPACHVEHVNAKTGAVYYRFFTADGDADVVRYDRETGEQATLYHGAVEHIAWVSQDEHLVALMLNDEPGQEIFVLPDLPDTSGDYFSSHLSLLDLTTGKELYQMPAVYYEYQGWFPQLTPYAENLYFLSSDQVTGSNTLIQLYEDGHVGEILVEGYFSPPLGGGWALMTPYYASAVDDFTKFDLFNVQTGQTVRLVDTLNQPNDVYGYAVRVKHLHDNVFRVTIGPMDRTDLRRAIYEVRVAGVDIPDAP